MPTASEKIRFAREEEISREYDRQFVELAKVNDLDLLNWFLSYRTYAVGRSKYFGLAK